MIDGNEINIKFSSNLENPSRCVILPSVIHVLVWELLNIATNYSE